MNHEDPSHISDERAQEFAEAYKKDFGEEISLGEARLMLGELVELCRLLARPLPGEEGEPRPQ